MTEYINNDNIRVGADSFGAELCTVTAADGTEYLWQGDPAVWSGRSPILFPIVGRLIDDAFTFDGRRYTCPKHGLVRKSEFALYERTGTSMTFVRKSDEATRRAYPFDWELYVTFSVSGSELTVDHRVVNTGDGEMFFSLGAHPAFICRIGDYVEFERPERLISEKIDLIASIRTDDTVPVLDNETRIYITKDVFKEDALILSGMKSEVLTLHRFDGRTVRFNFGKCPYLGLWAKPGAPYVCVEPWYGVNDSCHSDGDLRHKDRIIALPAGGSMNFSWSALFE